jgi:DNA-binding GntR family transcriptional regulator
MSMGDEAAAALECEPGVLAVCIRRSYYLPDGTPVEVAFNQHRTDQFRYDMN